MAKKKTIEILFVSDPEANGIKTGVMVEGEVCMPGDVAEVGSQDAKNLISRGKAVKYTEEAKKAEKARLAAEAKAEKERLAAEAKEE